MNRKRCTLVSFDYGGYYSKNGNEVQWISSTNEFYTLMIKTSMKKVTYALLVEKICKKIMIDETTTKLKLSYIPLVVAPKRPNYILDDDDVMCFLMEVDKDKGRSVLYVEFINDVEVNQGCEENQGCEPVLREDRVSEVGKYYVSNEEMPSSVRENDGSNDDFITLYSEETAEQYEQLDYVANVDNYGMVEDTEVTPDVDNADQFVNLAWDDGLDLDLGQEFISKREVQDLVEKAAHMNCFAFDTIKSDTKLYVVRCCESRYGCKWSLRVAKHKNSDSFSVRTYNGVHTCSRATTSTSINKKKGTPRLVASVLHADYPAQFDTPTPKNLISMVQGRMGVKVSYSTALRGKKQAASTVRGNPEESYKMLYSYMHMLEKMNPGTVSYVELDEDCKFKYLFFALGACIEGFQAMRKVIIVDGTHLKTVHGGVLIVATAQDPNHHHYPIAFGIVDGEKDASWGWFFNMLKSVVPDDPGMVFLSDRNQSLIKSIREVYPMSQHGYCIFHLSQNVKGNVSNVNKERVAAKFRECAQAYTEVEFRNLYGDFRQRYPAAASYLDRSVEENKWARCYFPGERYNIDTTNCAESINGVFREARKYSLLPMIDAIVGKLAEWFNRYRKSSAEASESQKLVPRLENEMHVRCKDARLLTVYELNSFSLEYSVIGHDGNNYLVDLTRKTCSCKYFDIDRYPCVHAIAAVMSKPEIQIQVHDLCSKYYWMEQWSLAYCRTIYPVPHQSQWTVPDHVRALYVLPPDYVKKKGRTQERRFPSVGEYRRRKQNTA